MKAFKIKLLVLGFLLLLTVLSVWFAWRADKGGILTVAFLDIGQGDALFIEAPSGNQVLIDGGPGKSVLRALSGVMPFYDRSIDLVLATHADSDHIGGLPDVLDKYQVGLFMEPGLSGDSALYQELERRINEKQITKIEARRGMNIDLGDGSFLQILFPDRDPSNMDTNTSSIVAKLIYGESEFLLTGDSPIAIENYLITKGGLQSDVLKVGHHGSKTSSGTAFVDAVSPQYAVISAGKDNRYGHPHQEVLDTLKNFGAKILRTDELGRIIFKSDGVDLKITK